MRLELWMFLKFSKFLGKYFSLQKFPERLEQAQDIQVLDDLADVGYERSVERALKIYYLGLTLVILLHHALTAGKEVSV